MSWFNNLKSVLKLTQHQRQTFIKMFGNFEANKLFTDKDRVIQQGYESNVDVYSIIRTMINAFKNGEWKVKRKTSEGFEIVEDSPIQELFANPNATKGYTMDDIDEMLLTYLWAGGNSFLYRDFVGNRIAELDVLPNRHTEIIARNLSFFMPNVNYQFDFGSSSRKLTDEEVCHIKFFNPSYEANDESFWGLSPIRVAAMAVKASNDRWEADANILQNRGRIGMVTDSSELPMSEEEAQKVQSAFDRQMGGASNYGGVRVITRDLKYIPMAMSSADLQLLEKGVVNLRALCSVYGVPSELFNDPANKVHATVNEASKSLYTRAVVPMAIKVAEKYTQFIAKRFFPLGDHIIYKDFSKVEALQSDKKLEAEKDKIKMDGINVILNMPIGTEGKKELLKSEYDFSEDQAIILTSKDETQNETTNI